MKMTSLSRGKLEERSEEISSVALLSPACIFLHLSVRRSLHKSLHPLLHLLAWHLLSLSVCQSVCQSVDLPVRPCIRLLLSLSHQIIKATEN